MLVDCQKTSVVVNNEIVSSSSAQLQLLHCNKTAEPEQEETITTESSAAPASEHFRVEVPISDDEKGANSDNDEKHIFITKQSERLRNDDNGKDLWGCISLY